MAFVYVIRAPLGFRKIGHTTASDVAKRLRSVAEMNALHDKGEFVLEHHVRIDDGSGLAVEEHAHALLWDTRVRGEWFDVEYGRACQAIADGIRAYASGAALKRPSGISKKGALWRSYPDLRISRPSCPRDIENVITGAQIRGACAILRWSVKHLAAQSGLSHRTVTVTQADDGVPVGTSRSLAAVQAALEGAGIEFLPDNGVRLRRRAA